MNKQKDTILVTGATGQQGGAVTRHLLSHGYKVRALARQPEGEKARALAALGAGVVRGDFNEPELLRSALTGMWGVFAVQTITVQTTWEAAVEKEVEQGKRLAELAYEAGVSHFVYSSIAQTDGKTGVAHYDSKWRIEESVRALGFPSYTILRPVFFIDNFASETTKVMFPELGDGKLVASMQPDTALQMIASDDIGRFGWLAFERHEKMNGLVLDIAGDEHTMPQTAAILSQAWGRKIEYTRIPVEEVNMQPWAESQEWFERVGFHVDIAALEKRSGMHLTKLTEWAEKNKSQ